MTPISQLIEPVPIRYVGNYLAFKMNSDPDHDETWRKFLDKRGIRIGATKQDIVPLATGGTFAEAVLGRFNCAEKLDLTRFWNWRDSPTPLQPTEIAAIQTGSRATNEDVKPGQLSNPIINITSPASLPDPSGTAAVLAAIQNGNMFRDMSGLQATIGMAQSALQGTAAGAATAGQQAGTNMKTLVDAATERQRVAADLIASVARTAAAAYTGGAVSAGGGITSGSNHSQDGAKVNYFDKTKTPAQPGTAGGSSGSTGGAASSGGGSASGATPSNGSAVGGRMTTSGADEYSQNPAALAATWGDSQAPSGLLTRIVDKLPTDLGEGEDLSASPLTNRQAWPKLDSTVVLPRIKVLTADADAFDQGALGLCTAAAFFHHVIQRDASKFQAYAEGLYGSGMGFLGGLTVKPGSALRSADYAALLARFPRMPPQADWMAMAALRDSANWFSSFEGAPDEKTAISSSAKEMSIWYKDCGMYSSVTFDDDASLAKIKKLKKDTTNQLALWIKVALVQPGDATHMITVESPIFIDEATDKISFDYWTWGQKPRRLETTLTAFKANYLGSVVAKF